MQQWASLCTMPHLVLLCSFCQTGSTHREVEGSGMRLEKPGLC
jgi:hypothetical protein